jgi:hypothetical protein
MAGPLRSGGAGVLVEVAGVGVDAGLAAVWESPPGAEAAIAAGLVCPETWLIVVIAARIAAAIKV